LLKDNDKVIDYHPSILESESKNNKLDANHTHFILVDDSSIGKYGAEIEIRADLEKTLRNCKELEKIPTILIVVQGGTKTLETIMKSVENDVPVLVLAV
jgi:hypothetical protein